MPSTYAHYRMGQEVRSILEEKNKKIVEAYPELFWIGLHGPDILFYYHPLSSNEVNQIGYKMHAKPGKKFFENAAKIVNLQKERDAHLAYVYGFICHFALDETCHGYIDEKIAESGISHTEIEVEFDRSLMITDGYDPIRHKLTDHIIPSMENAKVIQDFFEGADSTQVKKALEGMIRYNELLIAPSRRKRFLINSLLFVTGNYKEMHGLVVNYQENPRCEDSTEKLWHLYAKAKELAVRLISEYQDYLDGKEELNEIYDYTFGSQLIAEKKEKENEV